MAKYISAGKMIASILSDEKAHSSITDWVEILSSDKYEEDSMDGIPELVESIKIQGMEGIQESSRALRKKLKYGNVHRQVRALTIMRALTENSSNNYQYNFMNSQLQQRLKEMAIDSLTDPKVKRKMLSVFHSWSLKYADDARMKDVAGLYAQYSGKKTIVAQPVRKSTAPSTTTAPTPKPAPAFEDFEHSWAPTQKSSAADYADLAAAKEAANARQAERDRKAAIEQREAELETRERAIRMKEEGKMRSQEAGRLAAGEEERRRKEAQEKAKKGKEPKRAPFVFEKERPQVIIAIANANQAASNLVNALRLVNREKESVTVNLKVLDYLEKAKVARRPIIRYIQVVVHEEFVGTLLNANEQIVEAIQLYDKLSKPVELDSDSDHETHHKKEPKSDREMEQMRRRLEAQKIEDDRKGELQRMQEKQKLESQRMKDKRAASKAAYEAEQKRLDEEEAEREREFLEQQKGRRASQGRLPPPITPDDVTSRRDSYDMGSLSDFSDYDSSDEEYRQHQSRNQSRRESAAPGPSKAKAAPTYASLEDDETPLAGAAGAYDPFADPDDFLGSIGSGSTSTKKKERMEWAAI